jgi:nitrite reductase/ring-hydroxylating ferredoxin subunit
MSDRDPSFAKQQDAPDPFIPAAEYFSREFAEREIERLWPRVWQMACREEDIPNVGDFHTYDIVDDSIIVVRTAPDAIRAYHNVCPHRGRRLTSGCGHTARFHCRFHGWQFELDGRNRVVVDREDWRDTLNDDDIALKPVKVGIWAGWIYVNMDPDSESLEDFLAPAAAMLDPFHFQDLRYYWRKSTILPCNWKVALEAFNEGYHLQQTHRQMLRYFDDVTTSYTYGRHSMFGYWGCLKGGWRSRRIGGPREGDDLRAGLVDYMEDMLATLNAAEPINLVEPARRLMKEVPADASEDEIFERFGQFIYEHAMAEGFGYPPITPEQMDAVGNDWHLFPNHIILPGPTAVLSYRARPNGHDPDSCFWDVYSLRRYVPGTEPEAPVEWSDDLADQSFWGQILVQDYENFVDLQRGLKSRAFAGSRTNPVQEKPVANLHRGVREFLDRA